MHTRTGYIIKRHRKEHRNQTATRKRSGQFFLRELRTRAHLRKMDLPEFMPELPCSSPNVGGLPLEDVCSSSVYFFMTVLNMLISNNTIINGPCERITPITKFDTTYDFIVVGGGAAGPVVAARLSEVKNWKVLLVEAGPDEPPGTQIPSNLQLYLNTSLDWNYRTTNESYACLSTNGSCAWPRGKNLGGCTSHHGMAYHRGHAKDYQRWVEFGNAGWSWNDVLPFFKKSEDNREIGRVRAQDHGVGGPMTVERFPWQPQFAWDVIKAARNIGLGATEDMVGEKITGFTVAQTISKDGVRLSAPRAFLWPHRNRKNLHVALNAMVTKVTTRKSGSTVQATGINVIMGGKTHVVRATKEVILSAGTLNSPHLLLLSGIGPKSHLDSMKITTMVDLPGVGENLHNHLSYGVDFTLKRPKVNELSQPNANQYIYDQTGPMASTGLAQLTGIIASNYTTKDDPDLQIFFAGYQAICDTDGRIADLKTYNNKETVRFSAVNLQSRSRGRITLASSDPLVPPHIWGNDMANPQDRSIIYQGIQHIIRLSKAKPLRKYGLTMVISPETVAKECEQYRRGRRLTAEFWDCQFRYDTRPENHQAGTCKMGPAADPMAVVNPGLKVHGVNGLRVADASIMPKMVSGNPVAAVNMIGERAADFIKNDYKVNAQELDENNTTE